MLAITDASAKEVSAAAAVATGLAQAHDAELTLLHPLSRVASPLPTGAQALAQREEFGRARAGLSRRVAAAWERAVRARSSIRGGSRDGAVVEELATGPLPDLVVAPAAVSFGRFDLWSGRALARLARRIVPPVLGVHRVDTLDVSRPPRIVLLHWTTQGGLAGAIRVCDLLATSRGAPSITLVRAAVEKDGGPSAPRLDTEVAAVLRDLADRGIEAGGMEVPAAELDDEFAASLARTGDLLALAADAPRPRWPRLGVVARIAAGIDRPVLLL